MNTYTNVHFEGDYWTMVQKRTQKPSSEVFVKTELMEDAIPPLFSLPQNPVVSQVLVFR